MADFGGINIPSPQEVLMRQQAQRDQFRQSSDPAVRRQATIDSALDTLFGNPQLQAAQRVTDAVSKAQNTIEPSPGESDLDTELRRLKAMRDAVADVDPSVAAQIDQRRLAIGAQKLERDKLLAEIKYKQNEDVRQTGEYNMKAGQYPLDLAAKQAEIDTKKAETVNYISPDGKQKINVDALDSIQIKRLQNAGWTKVGLAVNVDDPTKLGGPTKAVQTDLQKSIISADNQAAALGQTMQKFDPSFLTIPTQTLMAFQTGVEKLTGVPVGDAAKAKKYYEFRRNSVDGLNRYINEITGAAVGVKEEVRIREAFPDAYKDSPTQFQAKLRETVRSIIGVRKRAEQMLKSGVTQVDRNEWDHIAAPPVSDQEVDTFMNVFMGFPAPKGASKASTPAPLQSEIDRILKSK